MLFFESSSDGTCAANARALAPSVLMGWSLVEVFSARRERMVPGSNPTGQAREHFAANSAETSFRARSIDCRACFLWWNERHLTGSRGRSPAIR